MDINSHTLIEFKSGEMFNATVTKITKTLVTVETQNHVIYRFRLGNKNWQRRVTAVNKEGKTYTTLRLL